MWKAHVLVIEKNCFHPVSLWCQRCNVLKFNCGVSYQQYTRHKGTNSLTSLKIYHKKPWLCIVRSTRNRKTAFFVASGAKGPSSLGALDFFKTKESKLTVEWNCFYEYLIDQKLFYKPYCTNLVKYKYSAKDIKNRECMAKNKIIP